METRRGVQREESDTVEVEPSGQHCSWTFNLLVRRLGSTPETIKVRGEASIVFLGKATGCPPDSPAEVPTDKLCPLGLPKKTLAHAGPDSKVVPNHKLEQEQDRFNVDGDESDVTIEETPTHSSRGDHSLTHGASSLLSARWCTRSGGSARCQRYDFERTGELRLDISSYSKNYQRGFGRRAKYPRAPGEAAAQVGRRGCIENGVVWVRWGKHTEMLDVFGARIASQSEV